MTQRSSDRQGVLGWVLAVKQAGWGDEDESFDQIRRRCRHACADDAAERVSHEEDALEPDLFKEGADVRVCVAEDELASSRGAETRKVDQIDTHAVRERRHDGFPPTPRPSETVDKYGGMPRARDPIVHADAADLAHSLLEHDTYRFSARRLR